VDVDARLTQPRHLRREEQSGVVVLPVAVVEVAGEQEEGGLLVAAEVDEVCERAPAGAADRGDGRPLVLLEAAHRAVEGYVGGLDEVELNDLPGRRARE